MRFVPRFVSDAEVGAVFRRADLVVLPYSRTERLDQSGVLATALAFGKAILLTDVGSFGELAAVGAARLVPRMIRSPCDRRWPSCSPIRGPASGWPPLPPPPREGPTRGTARRTRRSGSTSS